MDWLVSNDPIIACSSGTLEHTAISVIRISGITDLLEYQRYFSKDLSKIESKKSYLSKVKSGENFLDEVLFTFFEGPGSFNGENILEISAHGNPLNIKNIIELFNSAGIRNANPGEITYRALRNNKLTMSQVEGLDTLLNANSTELIQQGLNNLGGALQKEFLILKDRYLHLRGSVEIIIDFSEDVGEEDSLKNLKESFKNFLKFLKNLELRTQTPRSHLLKPKVVLIGKTNAGKSTLFNKLLSAKRAIVSEIDGTTRDYVTEYFSASGVEFQLVDTAGLRKSTDVIEMKGIELSKELYEEAFYKVLVINPLLDNDETDLSSNPDAVIFTHSDSSNFRDLINKYKDLYKNFDCFYSGSIGADEVFGPIGPGFEIGPIGPGLENGPIGPETSGPIEPLKPLKDAIYRKYNGLASKNPILPERQRNNIKDLLSLTNSIGQVLEQESDIAILSSEINRLDDGINSLLGITTPDEVLNNIFSNFCIGK